MSRPGSAIWSRWRCPAGPTRSIRCDLATEGAVWGSIKAHGLLPDTVIVSDDAGQFAGGRACVVLGACRAADPSARHLHGSSARRPAAHAGAGVVVLPRSEGSIAMSPSRRRRTELRARFDRIFTRPDRLCHPRPPARTTACQQGGVAAGAGAPRDPAAHQRVGERHPGSGDPAQDQRRHALG